MFRFLPYILLFLAVTSCLSDDDTTEENPLGRPVNISFSLEGDITLASESPIEEGRVKSDPGTIFGVTVNKLANDEESFYLEGLFNSLDNIDLDLFSDESYVIYFTALQNGTSFGLVHEIRGGDIYFTRLFNEGNLKLGNQFLDNNYFYLQSNEISSYKEENLVEHANYHALIDRFNGRVELINPDENDSIVTIPLKRTSFGLAFRVENIDDNDTLDITLSSIASFSYSLNKNAPEEYQIRTLNNDFVVSDEATARLSSEFVLRIYDESNNFERERLISIQDIEGKRNVKRTYVIDLNDFGAGTAGRNSMDIEYLDDELVDEGEFKITG